MVGCESPKPPPTCPHESSPACATSCTIRNRLGSASALSTRTRFASSMTEGRAGLISKNVYGRRPALSRAWELQRPRFEVLADDPMEDGALHGPGLVAGSAHA